MIKYWKCVFFALSFIGLKNEIIGQLDFKSDLRNNNYYLQKAVFSDNPKEKQDAINAAERSNKKVPNFEMKVIVYNDKLEEHKKTHNINKFRIGDTVMIYDWDFQDRAWPMQAICKYALNFQDSTLILYNIQSGNKDVHNNTNFKYFKRTFKIALIKKDEFILLDKDFLDVRREYHFKKKMKPSLKSK